MPVEVESCLTTGLMNFIGNGVKEELREEASNIEAVTMTNSFYTEEYDATDGSTSPTNGYAEEEGEQLVQEDGEIDELDFKFTNRLIEMTKLRQAKNQESLDDNVPLSESIMSALKFSGVSVTPSLSNSQSESDDGLIGYDLLLCCCPPCDNKSPNNLMWKAHMQVCTYRDKMFTCPHCHKQGKVSTSMLEHILTHGRRRYYCSICPYKGQLPYYVRKHMRMTHGVSGEFETTPRDPDKTSNDLDEFILYPLDSICKDNVKMSVVKAVTDSFALPEESPGGTGKVNAPIFTPPSGLPRKTGFDKPVGNYYEFTLAEIDDIPPQSVFDTDLRCGECHSYATRVRVNLMRHLQSHRRAYYNREVLANGGVPVEKRRPSVGSTSSEKSNTESIVCEPEIAMDCSDDPDLAYPQLIGQGALYQCGFEGCEYRAVDGSMYQCHVQTLHEDQTSFSCPHCTEVLGSLDDLMEHFLLHGPRLYKCAHCSFLHNTGGGVEDHLVIDHPDLPLNHIVIRESEVDGVDEEQTNSDGLNGATEAISKLPPNADVEWQCSQCEFKGPVKALVRLHLREVHNVRSMYRCTQCSSQNNAFEYITQHFMIKHPGQSVLIHRYVHRTTEQANIKPKIKDLTEQHGHSKRVSSPVKHFQAGILRTGLTTGFSASNHPSSGLKSNFVVGNNEDTSGSYVCPVCMQFNTRMKTDMRIHLHRCLNYKPHCCRRCGKGFCDQKNARAHARKVHKLPPTIIAKNINSHFEKFIEDYFNSQAVQLITQMHAQRNGRTNPTLDHSSKFEPSNVSLNGISELNSGASNISLVRVELDDDSGENGENEGDESNPLEHIQGRNLDMERYACPQCVYTCTGTSDLRKHLFAHLSYKPHKCGHCKMKYLQMTQLERHHVAYHSDLPRQYEREVDKKKEQYVEDLLNVQRQVRQIVRTLPNQDMAGIYTCIFDNCRSFQCYTVNVLREHYLAHFVPKASYKCGACGLCGWFLEKLKEHCGHEHPGEKVSITPVLKNSMLRLLRHQSGPNLYEGEEAIVSDLPTQAYECTQPNCGYQSTDLDQIQTHFQNEHPGKPKNVVAIPLSNMQQPVISNVSSVFINDASESQSPRVTSSVDEQGSMSADIPEVIIDSGPEGDSAEIFQTFQKCQYCSSAFLSRKSMLIHVSRCQFNKQGGAAVSMSPPTSALTTPKSKPSPYICIYCSDTYENLQHVKRHWEVFHPHLEFKYDCADAGCLTPPKSAEAVNTANGKIYRCGMCLYESDKHEMVRQHLVRHLPRYLCAVCRKTFPHEYEGKKHHQTNHPNTSIKVVRNPRYSDNHREELIKRIREITVSKPDSAGNSSPGLEIIEVRKQPTSILKHNLSGGVMITSANLNRANVPVVICGGTPTAVAKKTGVSAATTTSDGEYFDEDPISDSEEEDEEEMDIDLHLPKQLARSVAKKTVVPLRHEFQSVTDEEESMDCASTSSAGQNDKEIEPMEEFSFYGKKDEPTDTSKLFTYQTFNGLNFKMKFGVNQLEELFNLHPSVQVVDLRTQFRFC